MGLASYLEDPNLTLHGTEQDIDAAAKAAKGLDAAIVIVGTTAEHEGEWIPGDMGAQALFGEGAHIPDQLKQLMSGMASQRDKENKNAGALGGGRDRGGDREKLRLPADQITLIQAVSAANPNTIVVIVSGSALLTPEWDDGAAAILQTFYSGMEGGTALAKLLYGDVSPSGKLPFSVADDESAYPAFDKDANEIVYDGLHGYTLLEKNQRKAVYPFGHGLSYARFEYRALKARPTSGGVQAQVSITNHGDMTATEVAQLYVGFPGKAVDRPLKVLRGFERVELASSETRTVSFFIPDSDLTYWAETDRSWTIEPGTHTIMTGGSSRDGDLLKVSLRL